MRTPELSVEALRITGLSFHDLDLIFDVGVDNPNPLGISLTGFDYDLQIEGHSMLKGRQEETFRIAAGSKSLVAFPLTLDFGDLRRALGSLADQDSTAYEMIWELAFELPVLGTRRLPLRHAGRLPAIKAPSLEVGGLQVKKLNLTGADLELKVKVTNANPFALALNRLDYRFAVDGAAWADGATRSPIRLADKSSQTVTIPIALDFTSMGLAAYRLLTSREPLPYQLSAQLDLGTSLPLLPRAALPLELSGTVDLRR